MDSFLQSGEFHSALCAFLWAIAIILFRKAGQHTTPVVLNLFKNLLGLGFLVLTLLILGHPIIDSARHYSDWAILLLSGAIGIGVADTLLFASLNRLGAGRSAITECMYSPFVVLCSVLYLREPVSGYLIIGLLLTVGAILIGAWNPSSRSEAMSNKTLMHGTLLGVSSAFLMAFGIVIAKPVLDNLPRESVWWATAVRMAGGIILLLVQASFRKHRQDVKAAFFNPQAWRIVVPAAFVGSYLATYFWISGFKYTYASVASILNQLSYIFVMIFATLLLREKLTARKIVAIFFGFIGSVTVVLAHQLA